MSQTSGRRSSCFSIFLLIAVLIASEMPLFAASPQSGQSSSSEQKQDSPLPDAPQPQPAQTPQQSSQTATGAAAAKAATVKGSPAAQPVGAAVAPPRQKGHRSLLIKVGLLAAAGIAVGSVVALSERSPTRPPGSAR